MCGVDGGVASGTLGGGGGGFVEHKELHTGSHNHTLYRTLVQG